MQNSSQHASVRSAILVDAGDHAHAIDDQQTPNSTKVISSRVLVCQLVLHGVLSAIRINRRDVISIVLHIDDTAAVTAHDTGIPTISESLTSQCVESDKSL